MEPQQRMENEWIAQVTTQEEETEWSPSLTQQKLHRRPRSLASIYCIIFMSLANLFMLVALWIGLFKGFAFIVAITNSEVVAAYTMLLVFLLGFVFLCMSEYQSEKGHSDTSSASKSANDVS